MGEVNNNCNLETRNDYPKHQAMTNVASESSGIQENVGILKAWIKNLTEL